MTDDFHISVHDKATVVRLTRSCGGKEGGVVFPCVDKQGRTVPTSVVFTVHVIAVWISHFSAVQTVQEPSGDLRH